MPTQCNQDSFAFASVEGRRVEAGFDGGKVTSDAGAVLLGAADRAVRLMDRFAACFRDARRPELIDTRCARWSASGLSASRSAMRMSLITTRCATIRCWRSLPAS